MASSTAAASSQLPQRLKKRRWTRDQLLAQLKIIGNLGAPLPYGLPPSPPESRAASPAAGSKRKLEPSSDPDAVKRPRTNLSTDRSQNQRSDPPTAVSTNPSLKSTKTPSSDSASLPPTRQLAPTPSHFTSRSEPCEDGEVREEPTAAISPLRDLNVDVPIRRPKKGKVSLRLCDALHDKYHSAGRQLKYSGDARFWSSFPTSSRDFRPIHDPPPPNSLYHKHGGLIARLELLDALVCFTYSIWNRDYPRRACNRDTWRTIEGFLIWCKGKWTTEEGVSDAERAFLGLIYMIEAFIQGRKIVYAIRGHLSNEVNELHNSMSKKVATAATTAIEGDPVSAASFGIPNGKAPPMLPSPSSANSTPVNREDGTPNNSNSANRQAGGPSRQITYTGSVPFNLVPEYLTKSLTPIPNHVMDAMGAVTETINPTLVSSLKELTLDFQGTTWCLNSSQDTLNLPTLRRCFPKTWARMMFTTLTSTEEHEPDFEDEEGELFWPDQAVTGEGLGWVCLMGKAMIMEFGKPYGYKSLDGVVPKPRESGPGSTSAPGQPSNQRSSTSSGPPR
ncbi:hypothetical protein BDN70DRAFT_898873 [Pholiota conissans]|uniref:Uncharacterized protein n=1 Tax=Pholiota conissans TaxID=109636 RepID=A0A9P6CWF6_9AGAR|nr:hypothetical protein BDN70DRAFT_898873 [Pholiota conissans]